MNSRVLQYFLAVAKEKNGTGAAEADAVRYLIQAAQSLQSEFPLISF